MSFDADICDCQHCFGIAVKLVVFTICHRAFHHYRTARGQKAPVKRHPELDRLLREEYRSLDDFRRARGKTNEVKED